MSSVHKLLMITNDKKRLIEIYENLKEEIDKYFINRTPLQ